MQFVDFEYDGVSLSSRGMMIVSFNGAQDDAITTDSQRNFESISLFGGKYQPFVFSTYDDRLEIEFSIGKNICEDRDGNHYFTISEIESTQYWLNRPTPHIFKILRDSEYADVYWEGSFNLEWVKSGENVIGFNATFISNRPYGLGAESLHTKELTPFNSLIINDFSFDEGSIIPTIIITVRESGNLEFTNTFNGKETVTKIDNCINGEQLTFTALQQLLTSRASHNVYSDFNWVFPRIYNLYGEIENTFTSNLNCSCAISYNPIRKVTFS